MPQPGISIAPHIVTSVDCGRGRLRGGYIAVVNIEVGVLAAGEGVGLKVQLSGLASDVDADDLSGELGGAI